MNTSDKYYLGIDLHKSVSAWVLLDSEGKTLITLSPSVKTISVLSALNRIPVPLNQIECVFEPVGCYRNYKSIFEEKGMVVVISNPSETTSIAKSHNKSDKRDAKELADLLRIGRLKTSYTPSNLEISLRNLSRERTYHIRKRASCKSRIAMVAQRNGYLLDDEVPLSCMTNIGREYFSQINDNEVLRMYSIVDYHTEIIDQIDRDIMDHPIMFKNMNLIQTIPGIGYVSAAVILSEVGDINRFNNIKCFQSFTGIVPIKRQSAGTTYMGGIHKKGPVALRTAIIEVACRIRGEKDGELYFHFKGLQERTKSKMEARVALARKVACSIYGVLKTQAPYKGKLVSQDLI